MFNYDSVYKPYSNTSIKWLRSDTEELYKQHLIEKRSLLEKNNWIDCNFYYTFNSEGFRCDEFTTDPTIMFLGCSNTLGIGLPAEYTWPTIVANRLNMASANLGQAGGAADTAFRLCLGWIDKIKPKIVIFLQPPGIRWELVKDNKIDFLNVDFPIKEYHPYMNEYYVDENNHHFNTEKNTLAIQQLCNQRNIKFHKFDKLESYPFRKQGDLARDLGHAGVRTHQAFADQVCNTI